jgi:BA14K-like protein
MSFIRRLRVRSTLAGLATATLMAITAAGPATAQGLSNRIENGKGRPPVAQPARPAARPAPVVQAPRVVQQPRVVQARPQPPVQPQRRGGGGGNTGRNVALGVGAAVIGGILLSESARAERRRRGVVVVDDEPYEDDDDRRQRCADRFRSFDWDDGTIVTRDGDRVVCPYLR